MKEHPIGTELYPGFGIITALTCDPKWGDTYDFTLEDGREIKGIPTIMLGEKYEGHCGTRFVTRAAYDEHRKKVLERYAGQESGRGR
jgi:hypothetical protein